MLTVINPQEKIIDMAHTYGDHITVRSLRDWCDARIAEKSFAFKIDIELDYEGEGFDSINIVPIEYNR
jgi:hypothetical protein